MPPRTARTAAAIAGRLLATLVLLWWVHREATEGTLTVLQFAVYGGFAWALVTVDRAPARLAMLAAATSAFALWSNPATILIEGAVLLLFMETPLWRVAYLPAGIAAIWWFLLRFFLVYPFPAPIDTLRWLELSILLLAATGARRSLREEAAEAARDHIGTL